MLKVSSIFSVLFRLQVYNSLFLDIAPHVKSATVTSIGRLGDGGIGILNLAVPKPQIPSDIAQNYKQVDNVDKVQGDPSD